jgi:hypothetical protein
MIMNKAVLSRLAVIGAVSALIPLDPAHAVVLQQKWEPGRTLAYKTEVNGTVNVLVPANAPIIIAGVPIEVEITGQGTTELRTLKVDEAGVGTVQVRVPEFDLQGQALGQKGLFSLRQNTSKVTLNGKAIKLGDGTNPLAQPTVAVRLSPKGRVLGVENLAAAPKPAPAANAPVNPGMAIDRAALLVATITRALPSLWPEKDVQNGETWNAEINWPMPSATDPKTVVPTQLGKMDLTLKGEETVEGRVLQRVGLQGTLNVDSSLFEAPGQKAAAQMRGKTKQEVKGDVWFDAAAGYIVRTDLVVGAHVEGGPKVGTDNQAWADFTGSVLLNLKPAA